MPPDPMPPDSVIMRRNVIESVTFLLMITGRRRRRG